MNVAAGGDPEGDAGPNPAAAAPALDRLWAGWRQEYVVEASRPPATSNGALGEPAGGLTEGQDSDCVLCRVAASPLPPEDTYILRRNRHAIAVLNIYPYTSGHLMVMPDRHVAAPDHLSPAEGVALWQLAADAVAALRTAYQPGGFNLGANVGKVAGAGVPGHLHLHCVPRWGGDTNFMTTIAEARVLPEALGVSFRRLAAAWPAESPEPERLFEPKIQQA